MQLQIFEPAQKLEQGDKVRFSDPSFAGNKSTPVHRWVPWIAGFSGTFVRHVVEDKLTDPGLVLDPFAGVGTTLVEAAMLGHDVLGFEINPYAALVSTVKVEAFKINAATLRSDIARFAQFFRQSLGNGYMPVATPPSGFRTRKEFYSPAVLRKVLIAQDFIDQLDDDRVQKIFRIAFAATMVRYSNYSYEPSLGTRSAAGKKDIEDFAVLETIHEKLNEIVEDVEWLNSGATKPTVSRVINASFFDAKQYISPGLVDLAITSPPYLNNYHYIRNTRPHLYWLGFADKPQDTKPLEHQNYGKFWQTVRGLKDVAFKFSDPPPEMVKTVAHLRSLNTDKGVYGGNGWANYATEYFNDCFRFACGLRHALKPGGSAFVVIGNSILQGQMIPTDLFLGQIAERAGLELVDIHVPRKTRVGNSIIQSNVRVGKAKDSHRLYESVVELRQPK